jgi:hypothetical protein
MQLRIVLVVASLSALAAVAACTLNPQPLPPGDPEPGGGSTSSGGAFGGSQGSNGHDNESEVPTPDVEGGTRGDGGTVSDANDDGG